MTGPSCVRTPEEATGRSSSRRSLGKKYTPLEIGHWPIRDFPDGLPSATGRPARLLQPEGLCCQVLPKQADEVPTTSVWLLSIPLANGPSMLLSDRCPGLSALPRKHTRDRIAVPRGRTDVRDLVQIEIVSNHQREVHEIGIQNIEAQQALKSARLVSDARCEHELGRGAAVFPTVP